MLFSCPVPGSPNEDNWVWQPMGEISMHQPEKWGMLQFSDDAPGTTVPIRNPEWTVRSVAMIVYYAEHAFYNINGFYTDNVTLLNEYASLPILNSSCCTSIPVITLQPSSSQSNENVNSGFVATMTDYKARYQAYIRDDRYLVVQPYQPYHATLNYIYKFVFELTGLLIK